MATGSGGVADRVRRGPPCFIACSTIDLWACTTFTISSWVWNVNSPSANAAPIADYNPGQHYADLYTIDIYGKFEQSYYDTMLALAKNKPIALAEVGAMPTLDTFAQQPRWAYFMMWSGFAERSNSPALLETNFHAARLLTLDSPLLAPWQPIPATQTVDSKEQTKVMTIDRSMKHGKLTSLRAVAAALCTVAALHAPQVKAQASAIPVPSQIEERVVGPYDVHVLQRRTWSHQSSRSRDQ